MSFPCPSTSTQNKNPFQIFSLNTEEEQNSHFKVCFPSTLDFLVYDILWSLSSNFTSVMCGHQHWTQHHVSNIGCRKVTTSSSPRSFWASILLRFTDVKAQKPCTENSCWDNYLQWPQNPVLSHCFSRISQPSSITSFLCSRGYFALCCIMIHFVCDLAVMWIRWLCVKKVWVHYYHHIEL